MMSKKKELTDGERLNIAVDLLYRVQLAEYATECERRESVEMESVDIVAGGYGWICPNCEAYHEEIEVTETVKCVCCSGEFETNPPEHAIG